jgi:hypothetical protein
MKERADFLLYINFAINPPIELVLLCEVLKDSKISLSYHLHHARAKARPYTGLLQKTGIALDETEATEAMHRSYARFLWFIILLRP